MTSVQWNGGYSLVHPDVFHVLAEDESDFATRYMRLKTDFPGAGIYRLRGRKMQALGGLFDEFGAALQFPYYFGENWAALYDCLTDLDWLRATDYLLLLCDAPSVLVQEPEWALAKLLEMMVDVHAAWRGPAEAGGAVSFRLILQCPPASEAALWQRLAACGQARAAAE
jgi:hypothetical protein